MTLSKKIKLFLIAFAAFISLLIAFNVWHVIHVKQSVDEGRRMSTVIERHVLMDMYHDAIRSSVLLVVNHSPYFNEQSFNEYVQKFNGNLEMNMKERLSSEVMKSLMIVQKFVQVYISSADKIVQKIKTGKTYEDEMRQFESSFDHLEDLSEKVFDQFYIERDDYYKKVDFHNDIFAIIMFSFFLMAVFLLSYAYRFFMGDILRRVNDICEGMKKISQGSLVLKEKNYKYNDEITDVFKLLKDMQDFNSESLQLRAAFNKVNTGLMLCNAQGAVVYHNVSLSNFVQANEQFFTKRMPNLDVKNLIGCDIDFLRPDDAQPHLFLLHQPQVVALKNDIYAWQIRSYPMYNGVGDYLGAVVEVHDQSDTIIFHEQLNYIFDCAKQGDLSSRINVTDYKDPMTLQLCESINDFMDVCSQMTTNMQQLFENWAQGHLDVRLANGFSGVFESLTMNVNHMAEHFCVVLRNIIESSESIYNILVQMSENGSLLSSRTDLQAGNLQETSASMEELVSTVRINTAHAEKASSLAVEAFTAARKGGDIVSQANNAMQNIYQSAQSIADIIAVIDEIAMQTDLLALNAAVEAARAGEAGQGFSVVAENVSKLAHRAGEASKQIRELILASMSHVQNGVSFVTQAGQSLSNIVMSTTNVAGIIGEIATSAVEQNQGLAQINNAVGTIDDMTKQNASIVKYTLDDINRLQGHVDTLVSLATLFKIRR